MTIPAWPDALHAPDADDLQEALAAFWNGLAALADLLEQGEYILADESIGRLRALVVEMMLGMNGIARPAGTRRLNGYLGESQRAALERALAATGSARDRCIGSAVALTVIARWYAPQMAERFALHLPHELEARVLGDLASRVPEWPLTITTD